MPADCAISLMRLRPNGGQPTAKLRQEATLFDRVSSKVKYLHVIFVHLSGLRRRCGEPGAKWRHRHRQLKPHAAASVFFAATGWQVTGSWWRRMP
jgi:hypothetical protein